MANENDWVFDIETKIFTIVKTRLKNTLLTTYPNLQITQQKSINAETKFPTIYITMLPSPEIGGDLVGETTNGMIVNFEVHITVSKDMGISGLRRCALAVIDNFKRLRFVVTNRGDIQGKTPDTYVMISRFRRVIGGNEEINFET